MSPSLTFFPALPYTEEYFQSVFSRVIKRGQTYPYIIEVCNPTLLSFLVKHGPTLFERDIKS
jgi:hypothetical protein